MRHIAKDKGDAYVLEIAQGLQTNNTVDVTNKQKEEVIKLYKEILMINDLSEVGVDELLNVL